MVTANNYIFRPLTDHHQVVRGDSGAISRGLADRPDHDQQHCYHRAPTVKPEAATAVVELPMMGVKTPQTC